MQTKINFLLLIVFTFSISLYCRSATIENNSTPKPTDKENRGDIVNQGRYLVGPKLITERDIKNMQTRLGRLGQRRNLRKKAINALVERRLVLLAAQENAFIVTDERIEKEIERQSTYQGISKEQFRKKIERELRLPFSEWVKELRYKLIKKQLIQFSLQVPHPSQKEIKRFYRKNRYRIGVEFKYREIVLQPKNSSLKEEARISAIANNLHRKLLQAPKNFARIARSSPHNNSPYKFNGGLRPYRSVYNIASKNPILASILFRHRPGEIVRPFRDSLNRYMIIKVERRRPLPLKKVQDMILYRLYAKKENEVFNRWLIKRKEKVIVVNLSQ